jgi:prepilin-type N-terminal cleavage/methylation domain-containing protein
VRHRIRNLHLASEQGFSMVEVIIAMFVFAVAVLGLASVAMSSVLSLRHTRDREQSTNAASAVLEEVRGRDFTDIFLDPAAYTGCFEGEPVANDAVNASAGATAVPHVQSRGNDGVVEVTTYVTYAQEDDSSPGSCDASDTEDDIKRVVTVARWVDRDGPREVRQETLITSGGRGLPVPDFDFTPSQATMSIHVNDTLTDPTEEVCARHQLRNLGADDTYDWALMSVDGASSGPFRLSSSVFQSPSGKWNVRALMQYPATTNTTTPPDPATDPTTVVMTDTDGTPPNRPESDLQVAPGASANFWFCYQPKQGTLSVGDQIVARLQVHSRFDPNRYEAISHTVKVTNELPAFYLYDRLDSVAHDRDSNPNVNQTVYPTFTMGPEDGIAGSPDNLGTIDYADRNLSDWDQEVDVDRLPGLRLVRGNAQLGTVAWHEGFLTATTLASNPKLTLYVSTTEALKGQVDPLVPSTHQSQTLQITLSRLDRQERLPGTILKSVAVTYTQDRSGWIRIDPTILLDGPAAFANNEFLRLQVTCASATSASDCHIGYDNGLLPSNLQVGVL